MSYDAIQQHLDGAALAINPTDTVFFGPVELRNAESISGHLKNTDGSQSFAGRFESSPDQSSWVTVQTLDDIAAGELRPFNFQCAGERFVRGVGTASGAGLTLNRWARTGATSAGGGR